VQSWSVTSDAAQPLLVDQRSAAIPLSPEPLLGWGAGKQVFVSSLITDMRDERAAARAAIERCGAQPVMFEDLGGQDISATDAYLSGVRRCDIYAGLFGPRYGVRMGDGYSATEAEFREAERNGLRLMLMVNGADTGSMDGAQRDLIAGVRNLYTTSSWSTPADLEARLGRRLMDLAAEELAPWVRVGRVVIRARELHDAGDTVTVVAEIRSDAVHAELVKMRDQRAGQVVFTHPTDSSLVQVQGLTSRSVSVGAHVETLTLARQQRPGGNSRFSMNGLSADEIARRTLADALFGTSSMGDMAWGASITDPLAPLRGIGLDDVALRPVSRLLIAEHLFRSGAAVTVDTFVLGPAHKGARRLRVRWTPPNPYDNAPTPAPVDIDGTVTGL